MSAPTEVSYGGAAAMDGTQGLAYPTGVTAAGDGGETMRIKVTGRLTKIKVHTNGNLLGAAVHAHRDNSPWVQDREFDIVVGRSAVPSNTLVQDAWTTLSTPLSVRAGDAVGITFDSAASGSKSVYYSNTFTGGKIRFQNADKTADGYWTESAVGCRMDYQYIGEAPTLLLYGDSMVTGYSNDANRWQAPLEATFYNTAYRHYGYDLSRRVAVLLGRPTAMGLGLGSTGAAWGDTNWAARVDAYGGAGAWVIANFGVNDLIAFSMPVATHQGYWLSMLTKATASGYRLIRLPVLHVHPSYTSGGHDAVYWNAQIDTWNAAMAAWCAENGVTNIDLTSLWDPRIHVSTDLIHPTQGGYEFMAHLMAQSLQDKQSGDVYAIVKAGGAGDLAAVKTRLETGVPNAAPGGAGGLPTVDASNHVAGVQAAGRSAIADAVLLRDVSSVEASAGAHSLCYVVLAMSESNTVDQPGKLTVYRTDGVSEFVRKTLRTSPDADAVTGVS